MEVVEPAGVVETRIIPQDGLPSDRLAKLKAMLDRPIEKTERADALTILQRDPREARGDRAGWNADRSFATTVDALQMSREIMSAIEDKSGRQLADVLADGARRPHSLALAMRAIGGGNIIKLFDRAGGNHAQLVTLARAAALESLPIQPGHVYAFRRALTEEAKVKSPLQPQVQDALGRFSARYRGP